MPQDKVRVVLCSLSISCLLSNPLVAQKGQPTPQTLGAPATDLPQEPAPLLTQPLFLRSTGVDYGKSRELLPNPFGPFSPRQYARARNDGGLNLTNLQRDGKIYLSLSDAITLALENNYDIAIARINLDIADTDILRSRTGASLRGVSTGLVTNTLGGTTTTITGGGGPGGTSSASGGGGTGANGLVLSTSGSGPTPEPMDPILTGTVQYEAALAPQSNLLFSGGASTVATNTGTFNFGYQQGFSTGTLLTATYNNSRITTNNAFTTFSPNINATMRLTATQHLLQGFGPGINRRLIRQAENNRQITDSSFRQQVLYTVNQVENLYWALVSAYEDTQDKAEALAQSAQVAAETRRQVDIGTMAGIEIVNADSAAASDKQALVASQSNLQYQQLVMKQALVRNLRDRTLAKIPIVPTDRVQLDPVPEEDMPTDDLIAQVIKNNPQIEQAVLNMKNNQITIKAQKNALLPVVDLFAFYGASALAGAQSPTAQNFGTGAPYPPGTFPSVSYGTAFSNLFNNSAPDKGVGVNVTINLRNRTAQADQSRSEMEYQQSEMRLDQLYTQMETQATNAQYALTNDRAQVAAAQAAKEYAQQSLRSEQRKYELGTSTPANVMQQRRNLAIAANSLLSATAAYAKDRAALLQLSGKTLDQYGFDIQASASGAVSKPVVVPGVKPAPPSAPAPPQ
ncbi:outer membrane protein [Terriglobus roseus DSM 18391]|uniref:Outer membrane protein n=1 Tax=Terriglobus roseus (strain DSM 18391 / NRRL B-41598 / KBS 63) TaxID=926566 RepID=I3ZD81_TERRK|nr:TolC family protein [Terriglobus roseus]AFL87199.1 outer membrane protein [Terriglobus roseus DSM 18391]